jgi:hypothetical protein
MRTETIQLYNFEELSEKSKENAIEDFRESNYTDYEWWEWMHEDFHEKLKEIGIDCSNFNWELDRGRNFEMDEPYIADVKLFLKSAGFQKQLIIAKLQESDFDVESVDIDEDGKISIDYGEEDEKLGTKEMFGEDLDERLTDYLQCVLDGFLKRLEEEYNYMGSDEYIREELVNNEWEFTEDGKRR